MQKKIIISALLSVVVMLLGLGVVSQLSVSAEIQQSLNRNLELATITSRHIDYLLQSNLNRLYDVSLSGVVDLDDGDWSREKAALRTAYEYSIFSDGLFLLDREGNIVLTYPPGQVGPADLAGIPDVKTALQEDRPFLTKIYSGRHVEERHIRVRSPQEQTR